MKILVMGGTEFLSSSLTKYLIITWKQLVETTMKVVNKRVNVMEVDSQKINISVREYFPFRNVTYLLDTKKAEEHGLYIPKIDLFQGLKLAYKWYCNVNPEIKDTRMNKVDLVLDI